MTTQKHTAIKTDWALFISVMVIFIIGMVAMMIAKVTNVWIWIGYILLWTYAEIKIAKKIHLKWWVWVLILAVLGVFDLVLISILH